MTREELVVMNGSKCILQLRGVRPFLSYKYDLTQHPNCRNTADNDKGYTFDIEKYLNWRMRLNAGACLKQFKYEVVSTASYINK